MHTPRVTFIIPCFNHGRFVRDAVRSCLAQVGADVRIVVVNDGSTDDESAAACDACIKLLDEMRSAGAEGLEGDAVRVVHQENLGLPAARNRGAREAAAWENPTEYLTFLDADDWVEPVFVKMLHERIAADAAQGFDGDISHAYCRERLVELGHGVWDVPDFDPLLALVTNIHPVTTLVRRDRFEAVGGFDETMRGGYEDWDLWIRFIERNWRGVRVPEALFVWRRHSNQTMIFDAVRRHRDLFAHVVRNHHDLYMRHAEDLLHLSNTLLRRADANWLDENLDAIVIRDLRKWASDLQRKCAELELAAGRSRDDAARAVERERANGDRAADLMRALATADQRASEAATGLAATRVKLRDAEATIGELRSRLELTERAREQASRQTAAAAIRVAEANVEIKDLREHYEGKPVVRLSRRFFGIVDRLPRPVAAPFRALANAAKRPFGA